MKAKKHFSITTFGLVALTLLTCCSYGEDEDLRLIVSVQALSISRLPYVIAKDQGLYEKYGLDVELWIASPESEDRVLVRADWFTWFQRTLGINTPSRPDVTTNGGSPMMLSMVENPSNPRQIVIASTDCVLRAHVIGRKGITSLDQLKGGRIGVSGLNATPGFHTLVLARRMGWDPAEDITIVEDADDVDLLLDNSLDAIMAYETDYIEALSAGLPIIADTREWNEILAGNSTRVGAEWLQEESHREASKRFLMALSEAISIFHQQPDIAMKVMQDWYGIEDKERARLMYERGAWIPRKPYPCAEGFKRTAEVYESAEMREHLPSEFYDDSIIRELDASGFIGALYK